MAYSPVEQGVLAGDGRLARIADRYGVSRAQVALAWVLREEGVIAIPKASNPDHVRQNCAALDVKLAPADLQELDRAYPPPTGKQPLEML